MKKFVLENWLARSKKDLVLAACLIGMVAIYRVLPHPYNFAPVTALAVFGGACFSRRWLAIVAPVAAMLLGDLVLGMHSTWLSVYACFVLTAILSSYVNQRASVGRVLGTSLASSIFFFVVTNLQVWWISGMYEHTTSGFVAAYVMALPFFQASLFGDLIFTLALFGAYALTTKRVRVANFA